MSALLQDGEFVARLGGDEFAGVKRMTGNDPAAEALTRQALAVGQRCCHIDLVAFAKCYLGRALVRQGSIDEGIASLDEAMLPVVDGKLSPVVTGLIYCNLIDACRQIYAFDRSREWTDAMSNWCGSQPQLVQFNGLCRLHRAEIMSPARACARLGGGL